MILTLYGFEIVAEPFSVKSDSSSANRALARSIELPVVSTQPDPRFSPCQYLAGQHHFELLLQTCLLLLAPSNKTTRRCGSTSPSHATELRLALLFPLSCLLTQVRLGMCARAKTPIASSLAWRMRQGVE